MVASLSGDKQQRVCAAVIPVHSVERYFLRARTAAQISRLTRAQNYSIVHVNEPHALTAAWLARAHRRAPLLVSRRGGYPLSRHWVSRFGDVAPGPGAVYFPAARPTDYTL